MENYGSDSLHVSMHPMFESRRPESVTWNCYTATVFSQMLKLLTVVVVLLVLVLENNFYC